MTTPADMADLRALEQQLGYRFTDGELLRRAMAHRSWCAEHGDQPSNERLEFLGDAVLGWVIADLVYRRHVDLPEGKLTDLRKSVVSAVALAEVARSIDLGGHLLLGRGEDGAGGRAKASILSDALEAVIGAAYLDGGVEVVGALIDRLFTARLQTMVAKLDRLDHKTMLQELTAHRFDVAPVYVVSGSGLDHERHFVASVVVAGRTVGHGEGPSKKVAEQAAAEQACTTLLAEQG